MGLWCLSQPKGVVPCTRPTPKGDFQAMPYPHGSQATRTPRDAPPGVPQLRVGALARGSPLIWGKYSHESEFYSEFANITNILVFFY